MAIKRLKFKIDPNFKVERSPDFFYSKNVWDEWNEMFSKRLEYIEKELKENPNKEITHILKFVI